MGGDVVGEHVVADRDRGKSVSLCGIAFARCTHEPDRAAVVLRDVESDVVVVDGDFAAALRRTGGVGNLLAAHDFERGLAGDHDRAGLVH